MAIPRWSNVLQEFAAQSLLSAAEEVELAQAIEAGLYASHLLSTGGAGTVRRRDLRAVESEGRAAFQRFVGANIRLAAWQSRRRIAVRANGELDVDDLTSEGVLGVIRAVQKWDYKRGLKFSTYAINWVKNMQQRAILRSSAVSCPDREAERSRHVAAAEYELTVELGRRPSLRELADNVGMSVRAVEAMLSMLRPARSLDAPMSDGVGVRTLGDTLTENLSDDQRTSQQEDVTDLLARLTERERTVIVEMFGLVDGTAKSVSEIATAHRLQPDMVAQVAHRALTKMRPVGAEQNLAA
ncbi:sigma-70 family RNA polymerase sigma factor [Antrihabitans spumae]|uniref:Sigma-70 family RNA polymerase sigma factor n=1 Tax=Antrihabitans spumae TaxID=3373370 RepID=A0ABW7KCT2_9NOCA